MAEAAELEHTRKVLDTRFGIEASEIKLLDAGSTPNHYVRATSGAEYLVKALRSRLGSWVVENAKQVTALAAHAASSSLQTPAPVRALDGSLVPVEAGPGEAEKTYFVVLEWAVGYQRADLKLAACPSLESAVLEKLGAILGKLHSLPLPESIALESPEAPGGHCLCDMGTFLERVSDPLSLFPGQETPDAKRFRSWLPALAALWKDMPGPYVLCHGDAYLDNVLVKDSDKGPEIMIIDWEDSCKSNPAVDLAACAVGTCFTLTLDEESKDTSVEFVTGRFAALVRGYRSQRELSSVEQGLLRKAMQACAWACGAFRYGRFLEGVADVKTRNYAQLLKVVDILENLPLEKEEDFVSDLTACTEEAATKRAKFSDCRLK